MQVRDLAPGPADALVRIFQRRDEAFPGHRRHDDAIDRRAAVGEQLIDRWRDVLGFELAEARQPRKIYQRV